MKRLRTVALLFGAAAIFTATQPSPSWAQANAGLPVGSCVVNAYGTSVVIVGPAPGGYTVRGVYGDPKATRVLLYDGVRAASCPGKAPTAVARPAAPAAAPRAAAPTAPPRRDAGVGGGPTMGKYHCVLFIPGTGLVTQSGFTLLPGGRYTHQSGGGGTTRVSGGVIEFSGGPLTGQAGKVSAGRVNLFNPARTRTVIDCDTPG
jgi:hypothetical protein